MELRGHSFESSPSASIDWTQLSFLVPLFFLLILCVLHNVWRDVVVAMTTSQAAGFSAIIWCE